MIRPAPDALDQIIPADDPAAVAHRIDEKIEYLWFQSDRLGRATQFASLDIEHVIAENHPRSPALARARFLRKRQDHRKGKASASQSLPRRTRAFSYHRNATSLRGWVGIGPISVCGDSWSRSARQKAFK